MKEESRKPKGFIEKLKYAFAVESKELELTDEDYALLERLANWVAKRGMATPAIMFLETVRPLNFTGSQAMVFFQPILTVFFNPVEYNRFSQIFERRESVSILIKKIEEAQSTSK